MEKLELWYPLDGAVIINQAFGVKSDYYRLNGIDIIGHNGIDFYALHGDVVRAAHDGEVVYSGIDNKEGCGVVIRTLDPVSYNGGSAYMKTIYWHLVKNVPVRVGQRVHIGDIIGYADNTGLSTGDHLHFGLKPQAPGELAESYFNIEQKNGYAGAIDPMLYFNHFHAGDSVKVVSTYTKIIELLKGYISSFSKK